MASSEGFLTEEQRKMLKIASQNVEVTPSLTVLPSPKSPRPKSPGQKSPGQNISYLSERHHVKAPGGGHSAAVGGLAVRRVRRSHSGKFIRVKKVSGHKSMHADTEVIKPRGIITPASRMINLRSFHKLFHYGIPFEELTNLSGFHMLFQISDIPFELSIYLH